MTRLSEILRQLAGSNPKRKFKPRSGPRRRKSVEWKDGWDVLLPAPVSRFVVFNKERDEFSRKDLVSGGVGTSATRASAPGGGASGVATPSTGGGAASGGA